MPHWPSPVWREPEGTPTSRISSLLDKLGHPEHKLPPVIHVAGTNGKGSTIAFLKAILEASNHKAHCYTSPHLRKFNERIILAGEKISDEELKEVIEAARIAADNMEMRFFEGTTAAAFLAFSCHKADILLMESGLGIKEDPPNIIDKKLMTIITTISSDHTEYLGTTLAEAARNKASVMRRDVPCIISYQQKEALDVLEEEAEKLGVPLYIFGKHWLVSRAQDGIRYSDNHGQIDLPRPALLGIHQIINAGNAVAATSLLDDFKIPGEAVAKGLQKATWLGRMERISSGIHAEMLPSKWELWFDGGHNEAGGYAVAEMARENWQDRPLYLICGTTKGKDASSFLVPLKGVVKEVCSISVKSEIKSQSAEDITRAGDGAGIKSTPCKDIEDAITYITSVEKNPSRILVFGSLYLYLEATMK